MLKGTICLSMYLSTVQTAPIPSSNNRWILDVTLNWVCLCPQYEFLPRTKLELSILIVKNQQNLNVKEQLDTWLWFLVGRLTYTKVNNTQQDLIHILQSSPQVFGSLFPLAIHLSFCLATTNVSRFQGHDCQLSLFVYTSIYPSIYCLSIYLSIHPLRENNPPIYLLKENNKMIK